MVVLSVLFGPVVHGVAQDPRINLVPRPHDDFESPIVDMAEDPQGFLWLATEHGFYKYDGHEYTTYRHEPLNTNSPAAFNIWCLSADREGNIWFGPNGQGLDRLDPATGNFTHFRHDKNDPESLIDDAVTVIFQDRDGTIWIGTDNGLDRFDERTNKFTHYQNSVNDKTTISCNEVRTIYQDRQGTLWVGTGNEWHAINTQDGPQGGLNKLDKTTGRFVQFLHDEKNQNSLIDNRVSTIFEDSRGTFWVGTSGDGLHTLDRNTGLFQRHTYDPENPGELSRPPLMNKYDYVSDHISFINEDPSGKIWIGTFEGSINVYDPETKRCKQYDLNPDPEGKSKVTGYWNALRTSDNTLWISSRDNQLYNIKAYQNEIQHVYTGSVTLCFMEDDQDTLWIGTEDGLVHKRKNGTIRFDNHPKSPSNVISSIVPERDSMWVSTLGGLFRLDAEGKMSRAYHHNAADKSSMVCDSILTMRKDRHDRLWVGTFLGLDLFNTKKCVFTHFKNDITDSTSLSNNKVLSIAIDRKRNVWIGTFVGLNRLDSSSHKFKRYLKELAILHITEDDKGQLWCGTDNGLFLYNKASDSFAKFVDESCIITSSLVVGGMLNDYLGNFWMISPEKGIIRLDAGRSIATLYGKNQGIGRMALTGRAYRTHHGEILFPDTSGYFLIKPALLQKKVASPKVSITGLLVNDVRVRPSSEGILTTSLRDTKEIHLNNSQNSFSFEFNSIDFISEREDARLVYTMHNYDNTWRRAGDDRSAFYFNLPPGDYVFKVRAINVHGASAQRDIRVVIHPPWWKTWWAYSTFTLIAAGIVYALYRNRINQLKEKQTEQMILMVATQEGERKRISRDLHDDIGTKLSALKLSLSSLGETAGKINNTEIRTLAQNSEQFITEVMQDVRQLLLNLSPAVLEEFGYTTAIESLVHKLNETKQIHFDLVIFGWQAPMRKDYELALYRITQELINNVIRHAEAKNVSLQVGQRDKQMILMIEDDGKGFDVMTHKDGYGLHNLEARTKVMKGTMTLDSRTGKGTSVLIEIPYHF